jgi:hypothetical protein
MLRERFDRVAKSIGIVPSEEKGGVAPKFAKRWNIIRDERAFRQGGFDWSQAEWLIT